MCVFLYCSSKMTTTILEHTSNDMTLALQRVNKKISLLIKYYDGKILLNESQVVYLHSHTWQLKSEMRDAFNWLNIEPFTKKGVRHYRFRQIVDNAQMTIEFPYFYSFDVNQFIFLALTFYAAEARTDKYALRDEIMHVVSSLYLKQAIIECPQEPTIEDWCMVDFDDKELHSIIERVLKAFSLPFPDLSVEDKIAEKRTPLIDFATRIPEARVDDALLQLITKIFRASM